MDTQTWEAPAPVSTPAPPPQAILLQLLFGKHIAYCLGAIARLGVADHINGAARRVEDLVAAVGAHAPSLYRAMRVLASVGLFTEAAHGRFSRHLLASDTPGSFRHLAAFMSGEISSRAFGRFPETLATRTSGVKLEYGEEAFDLFEDIPPEAENLPSRDGRVFVR